MFGIVMAGCLLSDELLGLAEYYGAILGRSGIINNESEFRSQKLSMILDFIRATCIPERFKTELVSAIIKAWQLQVPEITLERREEELKEVIRSIKSIRGLAKLTKERSNSKNRIQLNLKVFSAIPITHLDFSLNEVPRIYEMLRHIMDYISNPKEKENSSSM